MKFIDNRERLPCDVCGKSLTLHSFGSGIPICPGIYAPGYRDTLRSRIAELEAVLEWYAASCNWRGDMGKSARKALRTTLRDGPSTGEGE